MKRIVLWVMSTLTDRAIVLLLVYVASGFPTIALTMAGGLAADRHDKRLILIATQVVQIATAVALGLLVLTGAIQIWHVILIWDWPHRFREFPGPQVRKQTSYSPTQMCYGS